MATKQATSKCPVQIGKTVFIRSVNLYYVGRIIELQDKYIVLEKAAWIADTGRFSAALASGVFSEVEPYPGIVAVAIGGIIDVCEYIHPVPLALK